MFPEFLLGHEVSAPHISRHLPPSPSEPTGRGWGSARGRGRRCIGPLEVCEGGRPHPQCSYHNKRITKIQNCWPARQRKKGKEGERHSQGVLCNPPIPRGTFAFR